MPSSLKFITLAMFKSAIILKEMGKSKKDFELFASEIWNSMEINGLEELKKAIDGQMEKDIQPLMDEYIKIKRK